MPIVNRDTGEVSKAQVCVGTLGASGYLYATAVASQTVADWLHCSVPFHYIHLLVDIRVNSDRLMVFHQRRQIASHALAQGVGVTTVPEHLPPQHRHQRDIQPEALLVWAESIGPYQP
ncbi:hypothetical protein SHV42_18690 [Pseudomonas capeferrum]|uniref:Mu transposase domain-containing protein n=1 Tax=Pseudomonas TaxID=286 RepID=UPI00164704C5|nr:hypothetical protein [Pseudomonas sp. SWRI77]MBC3483761.1 hypothetical protein [Pseudomonas sp. SWRI77]